MWHGKTQGLTTAAALVAFASLLSRLLGLVRDRLLASTFGAGNALDAYYAAFRLPDLMYNLLILGALSAAFIPVFTEYLERRGEEEAWRLAEEVLSVVAFTMSIIGMVLALGAPWIMPLIAPGFSPEKIALTVGLARIMFFSPLLLGLSGIMGGILQSTGRFFAFAFAPVLYNLGIIFGILFLVPHWGITGAAWGVVLGALLHLLAQAAVALRLGVRRLPMPNGRHEGVRRIMKMMLPRTAGLAVTQIQLVVLLALASSLRTGDVAVFNLATNLQSVPLGLVGVSYGVVAFSALARSAGRKDMAEFHEVLADAARKILFFVLPITGLSLILRVPLVHFVLGHGQFDAAAAARTVLVFQWMAVSLAFQCLTPLFARAFYAQQDTWTPVVIAMATEIANVVFALMLIPRFGIVGLAIAFSAGEFLEVCWLWMRLGQQYGFNGYRAMRSSVTKSFASSAVAVAVGYVVLQACSGVLTTQSSWQLFLEMSLSGGAGTCVFIACQWMLRSSELTEFASALQKRLRIA